MITLNYPSVDKQIYSGTSTGRSDIVMDIFLMKISYICLFSYFTLLSDTAAASESRIRKLGATEKVSAHDDTTLSVPRSRELPPCIIIKT